MCDMSLILLNKTENMTYKEITELIRLVSKSNLTEFKVRNGDFEIAIRTEKYNKTKTTQVVGAQAPIMPVASAPMPVSQPAAPAAAPAAEAPAAKAASDKTSENTTKYVEIPSPIVGTFYRSPSPERGPYVKIGDEVTNGQVVCIVEAMKLFNEIESEVSGKIVKVLVEDAQPVEYGQALFLVDPS